jgi:uncharacterized protein involved in exopolysaccharide biosynthesis
LLRRKWIALAVLVAAIVAAVLFTLTQPSLYRATATIEISRESARVLNNQEDVETSPVAGANEFYQTQYGLLKSRTLMTRVARELRLADNETFLVGYSRNEEIMAAKRAQREDAAVGILSMAVEVLPTRNSGLVDITASSPSAELSAQIANSVARNFIRANLERRFAANEYASKFLRDELGKARERLEESERNAVNYAANREIIELNRSVSPTGATIAGQSLAETNLDVLNRRLAEARAERIDAETRLNAARRAGNNASAALADTSLQTLRTRRADLQAEYSKQMATFGPEYPQMVALKDQIAALDAAISRQSSGVTRGLQSDYEAARATEQQLSAQVNALKDDVTNLDRDRIQYNIFQREADTNRALYDSLLERYKEIGVAGGVGTNNVAIVDPAIAPGGPYTPRPLLNIFLALVVHCWESFRRSRRTSESNNCAIRNRRSRSRSWQRARRSASLLTTVCRGRCCSQAPIPMKASRRRHSPPALFSRDWASACCLSTATCAIRRCTSCSTSTTAKASLTCSRERSGLHR